MNLNKLTKAELISKLRKSNDITLSESKNIPNEMKNIPQNKENKSKDLNNEKSITIIDFILYMKKWILTFTIIALAIKFFKKYKTIRSILYLINYFIVAVFGISLIDAFGFGVLIKLLTELKFIFTSIMHYLTHNSFYEFLAAGFYAVKDQDKPENESLRKMYEKKEDNSWKKDLEKRQREIEKERWFEKWSQSAEEKRKAQNYEDNKKTIFLILSILSLFGAAWYFSDSIGPAAGPLISIFNTLRTLLPSNNNDAPDEASSIILENPNKFKKVNASDSDSEGMMEYANETIQKSSSTDTIKASSSNIEIPPAPPAPPIPKTEQGHPSISINTSEETPRVGPHIEPVGPGGLFEAIRGGKNLKKTKTVVKDRLKTGKVIGDDSVDDNIQPIDNSLTGILSQGLDKLRKVINKNDEDDDITPTDNNWDEDTTQSTIITPKIDKGKQKARFLDAIDVDKSRSSPVSPVSESGSVSSTKANLGISNDSKIAPVLQQIKENFPNIKDETLIKLSTPEGLKNRENIINSISDEELVNFNQKDSSSSSKFVTFSELEKTHKKEIEAIVKDSKDLDSAYVIDKLVETFPNIIFSEEGYRESYVRAVDNIIAEGKTEEERNKIRKDFTNIDLIEMQNTNNSDMRSIRNVLRENYTHNALLNEIKRKKSNISTSIENQPESSYYKNNADTDKMDNTMNLFD